MDRFQGIGSDPARHGEPPGSSRASGGVIAIGATMAVLVMSPVLMAISGDQTWYALPLLAALIAVWWRSRLSLADVGFARGRGHYAHATLLPLAVVGSIVWLATLVGVTRVSDAPLRLLGLQVSTMAVLMAIGTLFTEDGFFRGALWGALKRSGRSDDAVLLWTSTAYALWYLPILWFAPSPISGTEALVVHALNIWLLSLCWGVLRLVSGSLFVTAWAHGLWSGLAYTLFGFGPSTGALGVVDPLRFDPERGWAGVAANAAALLLLWRWWRQHEAYEAAEAAEKATGAARREVSSPAKASDK